MRDIRIITLSARLYTHSRGCEILAWKVYKVAYEVRLMKRRGGSPVSKKMVHRSYIVFAE